MIWLTHSEMITTISLVNIHHLESVNSFGREARGPQAVGGNKTASGRYSFFLFSSNPVLSWQHLVHHELNFISNLELTNVFFLWKCFLKLCQWAMYFLGNVPYFKTHVNCFMAGDDSPCTNAILKCILWVRGLVQLCFEAFLFSNEQFAKPGMLQSMGLQRVEQDWVTELNSTEQVYNSLLKTT